MVGRSSLLLLLLLLAGAGPRVSSRKLLGRRYESPFSGKQSISTNSNVLQSSTNLFILKFNRSLHSKTVQICFMRISIFY